MFLLTIGGGFWDGTWPYGVGGLMAGDDGDDLFTRTAVDGCKHAASLVIRLRDRALRAREWERIALSDAGVLTSAFGPE
jgi:hypothetical protein